MSIFSHNSLLFLGHPTAATSAGDIYKSIVELNAFMDIYERIPCLVSETDQDIVATIYNGDLLQFFMFNLIKANLHHVYASHDLANFVMHYLSKATSIESRLDPVLVDGTISVDPSSLWNLWPLSIQNSLITLFQLLPSTSSMNELIVLMSSFGNETDIIVSGEITDALFKNGLSASHVPSLIINKSYKIYRSVENCLGALDPLVLWHSAISSQDIKFALYLNAKKFNPAFDYYSFYVGSEFIESLKTNSCWSNGAHSANAFEKISRVLAGITKANDFRTTENSKSPARIRNLDLASAKRAHITKGNPAYRLLFWLLDDGKIELANVGPKHECIIREGIITNRI